jgi:hypothetical protein
VTKFDEIKVGCVVIICSGSNPVITTRHKFASSYLLQEADVDDLRTALSIYIARRNEPG